MRYLQKEEEDTDDDDDEEEWHGNVEAKQGGSEQHNGAKDALLHKEQQHNSSSLPPPSRGFSTSVLPTPVFGGVDNLPGDYQPMCASEDVQAALRAEFVEAMMMRFITGGDEANFDYKEVDEDAGLDEFWSQSKGRDEEDAYFDAE